MSKKELARAIEYFRERAKRGDLGKALAVLDAIGNDDEPRDGDEL